MAKTAPHYPVQSFRFGLLIRRQTLVDFGGSRTANRHQFADFVSLPGRQLLDFAGIVGLDRRLQGLGRLPELFPNRLSLLARLVKCHLSLAFLRWRHGQHGFHFAPEPILRGSPILGVSSRREQTECAECQNARISYELL